MSLTDEAAQRGVGTYSSGNHAAAGDGAHIYSCEPTLEARESALNRIISEMGAIKIHPYNHFDLIAGQGSAVKELLEAEPDLETVLVPVGGGGLLSGSAPSVKYLAPGAQLIACEPEGAEDAYQSISQSEIVASTDTKTIADGLLTSLGELNFVIIKEKVDKIVTVTEASIIEAMRLVWERMKIIIEPSSAVPLAAVIEAKVAPRN